MYHYINVHSSLNQLRMASLKNKTLGPNILITGSNQSGKSTLCRILTNYSLKLGWTPMLCDLDLNFNEISPPGSIAAALVEEPLPNDDLIHNSLCFFHGISYAIYPILSFRLVCILALLLVWRSNFQCIFGFWYLAYNGRKEILTLHWWIYRWSFNPLYWYHHDLSVSASASWWKMRIRDWYLV